MAANGHRQKAVAFCLPNLTVLIFPWKCFQFPRYLPLYLAGIIYGQTRRWPEHLRENSILETSHVPKQTSKNKYTRMFHLPHQTRSSSHTAQPLPDVSYLAAQANKTKMSVRHASSRPRDNIEKIIRCRHLDLGPPKQISGKYFIKNQHNHTNIPQPLFPLLVHLSHPSFQLIFIYDTLQN